MKNDKSFSIKRIAIDALFAAMCAVLGAFSIDLGTFKFTVENFPILIGALLFGPIDGMLIGGVGSFIYQLLKYGIDASTILWIVPYIASGLFAGLFAKTIKKNRSVWILLIVVVANGLLVTGLNTIGLFVSYKYIWFYPIETIIADIPIRIVTCIVKAIVFGFILGPILKVLRKNMF